MMSDDKIACYYYPTTVVFLDDKEDYLDSVLFELDANIKPKKFTHPKELIKYLKDIYERDRFIQQLLLSLKNKESDSENEYVNVEHSLIDVDVFGIHKKIYNANRFNEIIIVVIDYAMPTMNGLEVCKALEGKLFKFIMLTGQATPETAIEGFNEGLIHRFVRKEDHDFIGKLQSAIFELQIQHFQELSVPIIRALETSIISSLGDPVFAKFFNKFCQEKDIVEYYLVNESGCFLMLDINAKPSWLVVKNEKEMNYYQDIAIDNLAPQNVIDELKNRKKVLFLLTQKDDTDVSVDEWVSYMHPTTKLEGKYGNYYYAYVTNSPVYDKNLDKIVSHKDFLLKR